MTPVAPPGSRFWEGIPTTARTLHIYRIQCTGHARCHWREFHSLCLCAKWVAKNFSGTAFYGPITNSAHFADGAGARRNLPLPLGLIQFFLDFPNFLNNILE